MKQGSFRMDLLGCILSLTISAFPAYSQTREIHTMKEIVREIDAGTLLIFDIDNTLIEPVGNMGSDQWYYYLSKLFKIKGESEKQAQAKAMEVWNHAQFLVHVKAVEKDIPDIVRKEQSKGIKTLALTARTLSIVDRTLFQLRSVHIEFKNHTVSNQEFEISRKELGSDDDALFKDGVLFVGETNNKGIVLGEFLKRLKLSPRKIVYVDDKPNHIKNVGEALATLKIPYVGLRYGALDAKVHSYNQLMSEVLDKKSANLFLLGELARE